MPFKSKAQQRFMFATMPKTADKWAKETPNIKDLPQHVENQDLTEQSWEHPGCEDKVGNIFVVMKPQPGQLPAEILQQAHIFGLGQYDPQSIHGVYNDEQEANLVAEAVCSKLQKRLSELEKKKDHVIGALEKHIARLQKEINAHMKEATETPELAEGHHQLAEKKMNIIRGLRTKHKMVKGSKKEVPKQEEK